MCMCVLGCVRMFLFLLCLLVVVLGRVLLVFGCVYLRFGCIVCSCLLVFVCFCSHACVNVCVVVCVCLSLLVLCLLAWHVLVCVYV